MLMAVSGLVAVLFARLKWPKVIGYILAGVLLSGNTWGGSLLVNENTIVTIGQLGIVFLMFALGLEFSASDMKRLKNVTLPVALLDTVIMTWLGYTVGRTVFRWGPVPSLFLGAAICDSSTTLLAKVIGEMKWSQRPFAKYVVGTSVCEDIVCIGIIALVTGVAKGSGMSFAAAGASLGGLAVFFLATLVFGLVLVPRLLDSVAKRQDDEALVLTLLGCCFFVSYVAFKLDFSLALGAFLVGILGSSSDVRSRLYALVSPLRSMFAAVFFVTIGLLVDPAACFAHLGAILFLSAVVMVGKCVNCFAGAVTAGEGLKTATQMGFGLAQIGEFAYMVALMYLSSSGDSSHPMYQIVVGVSLLTTVLNPVMLRLSDPVGEWIEAKCPERIKDRLDAYRGLVAKFHAVRGGSAAHQTIRKSVITLAVIGALTFAVAFACSMLKDGDWSNLSGFFDDHKRFFFCLLANLFVVLALAPIYRIARTLGGALGEILVGAGEAKWQGPVRHIVDLGVLVAVFGAFFAETIMLNVSLAPPGLWAKAVVFGILALAAGFGWRFFLRAGHRAAMRFNEALTADERRASLPKLMTFSIPADSVHRLPVAVGSFAIGETVVTLNIRARTGATVASVERNGKIFRNIGPEWKFAAGDVLIAIGDGAQIAALRELLEPPFWAQDVI